MKIMILIINIKDSIKHSIKGCICQKIHVQKHRICVNFNKIIHKKNNIILWIQYNNYNNNQNQNKMKFKYINKKFKI